ncbi:peptide-methionine (R)-S-oxide reductase [Roseibium denhamense]|uniref:Peptide methionine sulfoxide reductase MsrB n=1 Tax=Roseibium denhamense TaxID=76305 RepID=A0ABY1N6L5_9HYPH|nr:peptide-methionine (R)-S-oxide reductase MsrB [Roseibium denhamense]MTI04002.1 peptide-methionine (R)-S-oxide reductase [Roseibium denhamense]SMP01040.1 peptide-methionine (R)-S-oxide reductase [Roseibium denhamense]
MSDTTKAQKVQKTTAEWMDQLTPEQFFVTRQSGTERPFTGPFWNSFDVGRYDCVCCDAPLFLSDTKFDAGCGWPSFFQSVSPDAIKEIEDHSHGMIRTEIRCNRCDAHLGHVFPDGPPPTGLRYCMNGHAMAFVKDGSLPEGSR